jgi:hypothetical protein
MGGSRPARLLAAGALLLLVVVAARGESAVPSEPVGWRPEEYEPPPVTPSPTRSYRTGQLPERTTSDSWLVDVIVGVAIAVLLASVVLFAYAMVRGFRRRHTHGRGVPGDDAGGTVVELQDALEQARDVLVRAGGEPRDAVIRAWVTLENATAYKRAPHQTATEFTVALLAKETADEDAVRELRALYHRARFGQHSGDGDAAAARAALDRILATIR